ncbi:MAG: WD40 repeat domain-containing protein, partial [Acidobacteriota bacterium]
LPVEVDASANRYATSAMLGFEESVPTSLRRSASTLAGQSLAEYVANRPRQRKKVERPVALVFDQFEETLTADPLGVDAKREFFDQLGELLRDPRIWALFVLREDFLAPLDPYAARVPTHLENRFRIDLLGLDGAREAIEQPARAGGREFPAAGRLIHDLATRKVQQADGSFVEEVGIHVEPVQLQVVCFRLWGAMPPRDVSIDDEDLDQFGDVTESLAGYYADSVQRIAGGALDRERAIRDWFGTRLIRAGDVRGQVLRGTEARDDLDPAMVSALLDTHLIRAESRAGATWYELAHDRLIAPVRADNARWRAKHLSEVQEQATLWQQQGQPPGLLLRDEALVEGEAWLRAAGTVTPTEVRFLEASREAQAVLDRERRQTARIRRLGIAAMVIAVVAIAAFVFAGRLWRIAESQRQLAEREHTRAAEWLAAATGVDLIGRQPNRAALTLLEVDDPVATPSAFAGLYRALGSRLLVTFRGHEHRVETASFCADGSRIVTTSLDGEVRIWDMQTGAELAVFRPVRGDAFVDASLDYDGSRVALVTRSGVGSIGSSEKSGAPALLVVEDETLRDVHFAPIADSPWWLTTSQDGVVRARSPVTDEVFATLVEDGEAAVDTAVSADGRRLAVVTSDGIVRHWETGTWRPLRVDRAGDTAWVDVALDHDGTRVLLAGRHDVRVAGSPGSGSFERTVQTSEPIRQVELSPDGNMLAVATHRAVDLYEVDLGTRRLSVPHDLPVRAVAFGGGGETLVMASGNIVRVLDVESHQEIATLSGHAQVIADLAIGPEGLQAVTAAADGTAKIWRIGRSGIDSDDSFFAPSGASLLAISGRRAVHLVAHTLAEIAEHESDSQITFGSFSPDGERIATAGSNGVVTVWSARSGETLAELDHAVSGHMARFSADGERIVTTADDRAARLWSAVDGRELARWDHPQALLDARFSPDGELVMTVGSAGYLRLWATTPPYGLVGEPIGDAKKHVESAEFDPLGARIVTADLGGTARIFRVADGALLRTLEGHTDRLVAASFAPDGARVVTASADARSQIHDAASGALIADLHGHLGPLTTVTFSPDSRRVLTASEDRTARLWDVETGQEMAIVGKHLGAVHQATFSPDGGSRLLTTSVASGTQLAPHDLDLLLALNRARASGCLVVEFR